MEKQKLIVIAGPTAVGKTALSLGLAEALGGEIVSADSMQVYRGLNIGSAKATAEQRRKVPHHLIDICDPTQEFHVAEYAAAAKAAIEEIGARGKLPILVGGTGFYIQAVLRDIDFSEGDKDTSYRESLMALASEQGNEAVHRMLAAVDPASAAALHPNNLRRVIRALEFFRETGKRISDLNEEQKMQESPYRFLYFVLDLPREELYARIDRRVDQMMEEGLPEEVRTLKEAGCRPGMTSMQGLGYKELFPYLDGVCSLEEAVLTIKQESRHYAKRQLTWFRREKDAIWLRKNEFASEAALQEEVCRQIQKAFEN